MIVKVMKARKEIKHVELVGEVMRLVRFPLEAADMTKRIKWLIENFYMERKDKKEEEEITPSTIY